MSYFATKDKCDNCGKPMHRWSYAAKTCSNKCRQALYRKRISEAVTPSQAKRNAKKKPKNK